jgi:D-alanyl-D-alanine carboxypeptidase
VKALSGYATTSRGEMVTFSIFSNNSATPPRKVTDAIDRIVEEIVDDGPRK